MSRPSDHIDSPAPTAPIGGPRLGLVGYLRFFWRQLTSMRTALVLLLLLAIAAIPGSLVPQRSADPNGVVQYFEDYPELAPVLDKLQAFDVYTSVWFSSIYLLLFISLIGCVIPRTVHHLKALRTPPPRTPARLERLSVFHSVNVPAGTGDVTAASAIETARRLLRRGGYRVRIFDRPQLSVSAERGYLRETGNLLFHTALIGVLVSVGLGGGFSYSGQKVVVEGQPFVNVLNDYASFNPGRFFDETTLPPFRVVLNDFSAQYERENFAAYGFASGYVADVTVHEPEREPYDAEVRVNEPLSILGSDLFLMGNGYAPHITVTDGQGNVAYTGAVPFLAQDGNLTSLGVIKVPDALPVQIGMIGFFYPTVDELQSGALTSAFPDLRDPMVTFNVYTGDLGINEGVPQSVYSLNTDEMTQVAGGDAEAEAIRLRPGEAAQLPGGIGTVTFDDMTEGGLAFTENDRRDYSESVPRFAAFDIHHDPSKGWVLVFAILAVAGLLIGLFVPRRRVWVKVVDAGDGALRLEYAGLARGDDPGLESAVTDLARRHGAALGLDDLDPSRAASSEHVKS